MPAAPYDSTDLLSEYNAYVGSPTTDSITDTEKYARLSKAQQRVISKMMAVCPNSLYPKVSYATMPTLTTTDNQVFTFGSDTNGYPIFPSGKSGIYTSLNDIPDCPWREGIDYISEGTQIRIPNNNSYGGTLYWYGVKQPADITATVQPSIFPEGARELIVFEAARAFGREFNRNLELAKQMKDEFETQWVQWCLAWKTSYRSGGALSYFTGQQLALSAQL